MLYVVICHQSAPQGPNFSLVKAFVSLMSFKRKIDLNQNPCLRIAAMTPRKTANMVMTYKSQSGPK